MRASPERVDPEHSLLWIPVERKATPRPVPRMVDQFSFQRVHMHVVQLFDSLLQAPYIEIIKAALPEARPRIVVTGEDQIQSRSGGSPLAAQAARHALPAPQGAISPVVILRTTPTCKIRDATGRAAMCVPFSRRSRAFTIFWRPFLTARKQEFITDAAMPDTPL